MLSVIVPVYNTAEYLDRCVRSILGQTFRELEVLLVNDGSTDSSGAQCDRWAERDSRVRVLHQENRGAGAARNAGLDAAGGDFIALVDSDDWLEPQMYEAMLARNCDVVLCDCVKEHPGGQSPYSHPIRPGHYSRAELEREYFPHLLMMETVEYPATISNCLMVFRRELAAGLRYPEGVRHSEDLLFGARILYRAQSFFYWKGACFYHYRMRSDSLSHRFDPEKWQDYRRLHREIRAAFGGEDFEFSPQLDRCLLFFIYNGVGELLRAPLCRREKRGRILSILGEPEVTALLRRLEIRRLPIPVRQKILTMLYRHRLGISLLIRYYGG